MNNFSLVLNFFFEKNVETREQILKIFEIYFFYYSSWYKVQHLDRQGRMRVNYNVEMLESTTVYADSSTLLSGLGNF